MLDASRFPAGFAPCRQEGVRISATTVSHSPRHRPPPSQPPSISFVYPLCSLTFHIQFHPPHSLTSSAQACYPHPPPSYRPSWAWRPYLGLHHVHALVTDVLQGGGHVDLLGALRHAVQNHVHQAVGPAPSASVTAAVTPLLSQCASLTVITSTSVTPLLSQCAALTVITSTSVSPLLSQCATLTVITSTSVNPLLSQCATLTVITSTSVTPLLSQCASLTVITSTSVSHSSVSVHPSPSSRQRQSPRSSVNVHPSPSSRQRQSPRSSVKVHPVNPLLSQCATLTVTTSKSVNPLLSQCATLTVTTSTSVSPLLSQCATLTVITSTSARPLPTPHSHHVTTRQCQTYIVFDPTSVSNIIIWTSSLKSNIMSSRRHQSATSKS